jgi:peptidyl-prolyl cis-trans isomerase B (cyclophilin B)
MRKVNKKILIVALVITMGLCVFGCSKKEEESNKKAAESGVLTKDNIDNLLKGKHRAEIEVADYGTIKVELDADKAPVSVTNFVNLVNEKFYDGLTFHRIIDGFMIQGGDPEGNGTGGSEQCIIGEFKNNGIKNNLTHKRGALSMARAADNNSASSQFFIVHKTSPHLDGEYAVFGEVTDGMEIVDKICDKVKVQDGNGSVAIQDQPTIKSIRIVK